MSRVILHCDMNNFFASVECLLNPELKNRCMAVCGSKEQRRGIVLAKNEMAKKLGVITAEPIWQARKKCPELVIVAPHYEYYSLFSERAKAIYARYTDLVESFGIDECWLDVTGSVRLFGSGEEIAQKIRNSVRDELGLTVSIGVSFNKIFAKLGSDMKKPDAVTVIDRQDYKKIIYPLPVGDLLGVGKAAKESLHRIGIDTIGELAETPRAALEHRLGKHGTMLWYYANGLDDSPVSAIDYEAPAKSVGRGSTTKYDLKTNEEVKRLIIALSQSVSYQLRKYKLIAGGVQVAIRNELLVTRDFQCPLSRGSNNASLIASEAYELFKKRYDWNSNVHSVTVRAIDLMPEDTPVQLNMFFDDECYQRNCRVERAVDEITERFGKKSVIPMVLLDYKP